MFKEGYPSSMTTEKQTKACEHDDDFWKFLKSMLRSTVEHPSHDYFFMDDDIKCLLQKLFPNVENDKWTQQQKKLAYKKKNKQDRL